MKRQDDNETVRDEALTRRAAELFDDSVASLDAATRSQLNQGRQHALQAANKRPWLSMNTLLVPAGAAAAITAVAIVFWGSNEVALPEDGAAQGLVADYEMLLEGDELEMLEELEFYSWLELDADEATTEHVG